MAVYIHPLINLENIEYPSDFKLDLTIAIHFNIVFMLLFFLSKDIPPSLVLLFGLGLVGQSEVNENVVEIIATEPLRAGMWQSKRWFIVTQH